MKNKRMAAFMGMAAFGMLAAGSLTRPPRKRRSNTCPQCKGKFTHHQKRFCSLDCYDKFHQGAS